MKTRILTAAVALPVLIASIILPDYYAPAVWLFIAIAAFALGAGLFEFYSLSKKLELKADAAVGARYPVGRHDVVIGEIDLQGKFVVVGELVPEDGIAV